MRKRSDSKSTQPAGGSQPATNLPANPSPLRGLAQAPRRLGELVDRSFAYLMRNDIEVETGHWFRCAKCSYHGEIILHACPAANRIRGGARAN